MADDNPTFTTEELQNETWHPVKEFESRYEVSNLGRVRAIDAHLHRPAKRIIRTRLDRYGYQSCYLSKPPEYGKSCLVHRLVALAFLGPRPKGKAVNHIDGNKLNNRVTNLEYISPAENTRHAARLGLMAAGDRNGSRLHPERLQRGSHRPAAKLTETQVKEIRSHLAKGMTGRQLAKMYGVTAALISTIKLYKGWKHV